MSDTIHEYLIYIHGVSQDNNQNHIATYDELHDGVKQRFPSGSNWEKVNRCNVEWGWNFARLPSTAGDRLLADAQDKFAADILPQVEAATDITINPARFVLSTFRELLIKGFSDMFYYASRDGKSSIRATVASQIMKAISEPLEKGEPISFTFLGHSAGSVVAFDFLFYLFAPKEILQKHEFIEIETESPNNTNETLEDFQKLRNLADSQKLRVRRLLTFGSPISMLAFRSDAVLEILASDNKLNPSHYGLDRNPEVFGNRLNGPRWVNFWDKDDIISWPIKPLMQDSPLVEDIYADVGDRVATVHNKYWSSKILHEKIAALW
ncbi:MAG: hypothetical protein KME17_09390 [Cyanosarcina radialis HA8281-LM2]|jgi:hypothetical protein|nr:hypothetical protein [Cyanosarcina radialis HA8281-LM2]